MTSCGTTVHTDPDDYCVSVPGVAVDLVLTNGLPFKARVAWIKLRLAFLSLDPSRPALPSSAEGAIRWGDLDLGQGTRSLGQDSGGQAPHATPNDSLLASGETNDDRDAAPARSGLPACWDQTDIMAHREVSPSVEQELTLALVNVLAAADDQDRSVGDQRRADIMVRFADVVAAQPHRQRLSTLCNSIGVPQTTLRMCCRTFLACSRSEYMRIRRLNQVRSALSKAGHKDVSVSGAARSHGFSQLGRFAGAYRALFGKHRPILFVPLSNLHSRPGSCCRNL